MAIIILILFFIIIFPTFKSKLDNTSKLFIISFQAIWCVVLSISTFQPYGLYLPSFYTYLLAVLNVYFFTLGFFIKKGKVTKNIDLTRIDFAIEKVLRNQVFLVLVLIGMVCSAYYFSIFYAVSKVAESLGEVREDFYSGELFGPTFEYINGLLLIPLQIICYPLLAYGIYKRKWISIPILIFLLCYNSLSGGRFGYIKIFYAIIFFFSGVKTLNRRVFYKIGLLGIVLFFGLSYITASRLSNEDDIIEQIETGMDTTLEHITTYACGATVALDYSIENDYTHQIGGYGFGAVTGSSVVQVMYILFNKLGIRIDQPLERLTKLKQDEYIKVGDDLNFNALYTAILFFYSDFGFLGVIIWPIVLGYICRYCLIKYLKFQNIYFLIIVTYLYILTLFSITDFPFTTYSSLFVIGILYYVGNKKGKKKKYLLRKSDGYSLYRSISASKI